LRAQCFKLSSPRKKDVPRGTTVCCLYSKEKQGTGRKEDRKKTMQKRMGRYGLSQRLLLRTDLRGEEATKDFMLERGTQTRESRNDTGIGKDNAALLFQKPKKKPGIFKNLVVLGVNNE